VEKVHSEDLATLICIVHKTKADIFRNSYESLIDVGAVPRSARYLGLEDKDGN